jgi:NAD(P)-dependent dehydrogenase (short-subunit alcohol dehydrogenase family)
MTASQPVALVTGAFSGIGKAAALALADAGFQVAGTNRNASRVTPRGGVTIPDLDMTGEEPAATVAGQVIDRSGRIDVLLVEPANTSSPFDANMVRADNPAVAAKVIVAAATDPNPGLRCTSGTGADRVSTLRRIAPPGPSASRSANSTGWAADAPPALAADGAAAAVASSYLPGPGASYRSYRQQTGEIK